MTDLAALIYLLHFRVSDCMIDCLGRFKIDSDGNAFSIDSNCYLKSLTWARDWKDRCCSSSLSFLKRGGQKLGLLISYDWFSSCYSYISIFLSKLFYTLFKVSNELCKYFWPYLLILLIVSGYSGINLVYSAAALMVLSTRLCLARFSMLRNFSSYYCSCRVRKRTLFLGSASALARGFS